MPDINPTVLVFNGLDAVSSPDKIAEDEVFSCDNIDFSLDRGAAAVRRGSVPFVELGTNPVEHIFRGYSDVTIGNSPWYAADQGGVIYRITGGFGSPSASAISSNGNTDAANLTGFTSYQDWAYIVSGTTAFKDNGTSTFDWILQAPLGTLALTTNTLTPLPVVATYTLQEGTGTATTWAGTATVTTTGESQRVELRQAVIATNTNLNLNGTETVGIFGVHYIEMAFDEPKYVTRIHVDYSMDDSAFTNYLHYEFNVNQLEDADPSIDNLVSRVILANSDGEVVDEDTKARVIQVHRSRGATRTVPSSQSKSTFSSVAIPVTEFVPIVKSGISNFENAQACRIIIETWGPVVTMVRNWVVQGGENYPLTDNDQGLAYWETFAISTTVDGVTAVAEESAPSPISARKRITNGQMLVVSTSTATGSNGITNRILYRQGGFLNAPYAVGTSTYTAGTHTFTDTLNDIQALINNQRMVTGIRTSLPADVRAVSEPYNDRIFVAWENYLAWSREGQPGTFPKNNFAKVSYTGDRIQALHVWNNTLVIPTRDNVYEYSGNIFEGLNSDFFIRKSSARRGSRAPRATIKTPYGILLVQDDGLALYQPGDGVDVPLTWAMTKIGDIFKGPGTYDPSAFKGDRLPGMNNGAIDACVAAYRDGLLWFGYPSGTNTECDKVVVLDLQHQKAWPYSWSTFNIRSLFADRDSNAMLVGTVDGSIQRLEQGNVDQPTKVTSVVGTSTVTNTAEPVVWNLRTRQWTTPNDTIMENIFVEAKPSAGIEVHAVYDNTNTQTLVSLSGSNRDWFNPPLNGTFANNVYFNAFGSQTGTVGGELYTIQWNALVHPRRVNYFRTEEYDNNWPNDKEWEVLYSDIEVVGTGVVLATALIDNTAVMTHTISGPTGGRTIQEKSFPVGTDGEPTEGELLYVIYTSTDPVEFKLWGVQFQATNQPAKQDIEVTEPEAGEERIMDALDFIADPGSSGTMVSTVFVDCVAVGTYTSTGTCRKSFTHSLPPETYGRTINAIHTGTAFKHWKTWFHTRLEPDRWKEFNTDRESGDEAWFHFWNCDINPLGNTVTAYPVVDGSALSTYTFTGSNRQSFTRAFPNDIYGRTIYTVYSAAPGTFKHFFTWYDKVPEPDRALSAQFKLIWESPRYLRTLVPELDPLGGNVTAVVSGDGTAIMTATYSGNGRQKFNTSLEMNTLAIRTASFIEVDYAGTAVFKHYQTQVEAEAKPFGKTQWTINYKKLGGATRVDLGRFWTLDAEVVSGGTATLTNIWTADGIETQTNTITFSGRYFTDMIPFGPGFRGYLFQNKIVANVPVHIWASRIDLQQVGPKSVSIRQVEGTPQD